jgi:hypothetical protein
VIVYSEVGALGRPCHRETGNCRPEFEDLSHGGRRCWGIDEVFTTYTQCNDEYDDHWNPSTICIPIKGQASAKVAPR